MSNGIFGGNIFKQADSPFVNPPARRMSVTAASGLGDAGVLTGNIFEQSDSPFVNPPARRLTAKAAAGFGGFGIFDDTRFIALENGQPRVITRPAFPGTRGGMRGMGGCGCW